MQSKLLILIGMLLLTLQARTVFAGSLHADAGVTSDYVWRGLSQTSGGPAVSGGIEYVTDGSWYFGSWVSNTTHGSNGVNSAELDYYFGLSGKGTTLGYDVGYISYTYPQSSGLNFSELYFAFMAEGFAFKYSDSSDEGSYMEGSVTYKLPAEKTLTIHAGYYNRKNGTNYFDTSVTLRIKEFSITFSQADVDTDQDKDMKAYVSWNTSF